MELVKIILFWAVLTAVCGGIAVGFASHSVVAGVASGFAIIFGFMTIQTMKTVDNLTR